MPRVFSNQNIYIFDKEELKGFSRSMAELQWLLMILVMLYFFIPTHPVTDSDGLIFTMVGYSMFVLLFRYQKLGCTGKIRW